MATSTHPEQQLLAGQEATQTASTDISSDRPGVPRIEVPIGSEHAIDLNSPPGNEDFVDAPERPEDHQSPTAVGEHRDDIPLSNMSAAQSGETMTGLMRPNNTSDVNTSSIVATDPATDPQHQSAIEPAKVGSADDVGPGVDSAEPAIYTTLCIANTDNRHRWRITADYLRRRNEQIPVRSASATVPGDELLDITVNTVKRLLIADWRHDWEYRPTDTSQIRLISMGGQLSDEKTLRDYKFHIDGPPRPILMSVKRPPEDDQDGEGDVPGKGSGTGGENSDGRRRMCGCCTVM